MLVPPASPLTIDLPENVRLGSVTESVRRLTTGIEAFDTLLGGGFPRGRLSEIVSMPSAGGTALAWALLANTTRLGGTTAIVDLPDALYPESLLAAGADLQNVLWVRPPSLPASLRCAELILTASGFALVILDLGLPDLRHLPLHVWPRLGRVARKTETVLAVLTHRHLANSFATISLVFTRENARWERNLFEGLTSRARLERNKLGAPTAASFQFSAR